MYICIYNVIYRFMASIVRNKLTIIPKAKTSDEYIDQINDVEEFCEGIEGREIKIVSFNKIAPKPTTFTPNSKEEDDWLLRNWGTRNRAFNVCWVSDNEIIFDTLWNPAIPIFMKIAKQFPNVSFSFKYAKKERVGTKTGELCAYNGNITLFRRPKAFSRDAFEIAFELMPHLRNYYTLNMKTDEYEYDVSDFKASLIEKGYYKEADGTTLKEGLDDMSVFIDDLPF